MADQSMFKFYSMGIVVETKKDNTDLIKVHPIEVLQLSNGPLANIKHDYDHKAPDGRNIERQSTVKGEAFVVAKWTGLGNSNRMTAPDVVASETVAIYTFADTNQYFWDTMMREPKLRRLERVCHAVSNISSGLTAFDKKSSYWNEWSTKDKHLQIHTSKNDGEPFEYDIKLDTKKGILTFKDDVGNFFTFDSSTSEFTVEMLERVALKDETGNNFVEIISGTNTVNVVADKHINMRDNSGNSVVIDSDKGKVITTATSQIELNAPLVTVNGVPIP